MNLCDIKTVKRIMSEHETGTKKAFGQNFLINPEVPYNIARQSYDYHREKHGSKDGGVIEIGPGIGALTNELAPCYNKVVAIEIDKALIPILEKTLAEHSNIKVINEDFLKLDTMELITTEFDSAPVSVCANLPYYITTPIIMKLLEGARVNGKNRLTSITVMVQKEVAERLCATTKKGDYGAITASINYYGEVKKLFDVGPQNFLPAPKVTSSVVRIELYDEPKFKVNDEKMLFDVIAGAFAQRRKTLLNSLSSYFSWVSKERIGQIIEGCGFEISVRGEKLSIQDFCTLADAFYKEKTKAMI
ncbi:MAG: 16S rRNA (adenine(1518)-N(6)/adenine(1519)-N(6))-dimethyltransferase RsmA [Clostridia bacterium]|nr:16S rRNA (adenine(1518)-N(6)/adenine(1519)-N(6))-dimethyltransferase RsmA [Clostridia bacterium]